MGAKDDKRAKAERARQLLGISEDGGEEGGTDSPVLRPAAGPAAKPKAKITFERGITPVRFEPCPIDPRHHPKKHAPGSLKRGDSVWYHDQRYWVESAPPDWEHTCTIRISSERVHPDWGRLPPKERESFCVHADLLSLAPAPQNIYLKCPTLADEQRKERAKDGQRDIGDDIAHLLRGKDLDECYTTAARFLREPEDGLRTKYGHLNPGQQRMNLGNKMRFFMKKGMKHE
jgi:hypothetical protein